MLRSSGVLLDDEQLLEQHEPEMLSTHPTDAVATDSVLLAILGTMILPKDDDEDTPVIVYSGSQQSNMFLRSAYDVLALHLRGLPPPPDHVWRMVRYNARGKLETWRPRVNQQQIKCIVGARLPAKDDEWAAVLTALTEHRDILKSPPEHVLHVLKTYARNLQNVWRNRSLSSASTRPTTASPAKRTAADMQAEQQHSQQSTPLLAPSLSLPWEPLPPGATPFTAWDMSPPIPMPDVAPPTTQGPTTAPEQARCSTPDHPLLSTTLQAGTIRMPVIPVHRRDVLADEVAVVIVGGQRFQTSMATLRAVPGSVLAAAAQCALPIQQPVVAVFDRNPQTTHDPHYWRQLPTDAIVLHRLMAEAVFYEVYELVGQSIIAMAHAPTEGRYQYSTLFVESGYVVASDQQAVTQRRADTINRLNGLVASVQHNGPFSVHMVTPKTSEREVQGVRQLNFSYHVLLKRVDAGVASHVEGVLSELVGVVRARLNAQQQQQQQR